MPPERWNDASHIGGNKTKIRILVRKHRDSLFYTKTRAGEGIMVRQPPRPKHITIMAYMTQEGYNQMVAQLKHMEQIERPAASAAIAEARDKGDLSENSEYDAAKEAQAMLEMKINKLKTALSEAKIIDTSKLSNETVQILSTVEMKNVKLGTVMKYTIVSESEANLKEGKISSTTPIAQGLLGKKVGDVVTIKIPRGEIQLEILKISI